MANGKYTVSSSPHIRSTDTIQSIMQDVFIALLPAAFAGVWFFRFSALWIILISIVTCVGAEALWQKLTNQKITINDFSAAVTGLLLALNLPPTVPFWIPIVGGVFAIIVVKQFFGGLGQNFMNPALAARVFLLTSWTPQMTSWTFDGMTTATPLGILKEGGAQLPSLADLLIGRIGGCIGETSAIALLIGAAYLLYKKVISIRIPATFIGTVFVLTWLLGRGGMFYSNALYEIFTGGLILGAFFMATDYASSPVTEKGQYIMGLGCGIITAVIRLYGGLPEGVSYAILIMNLAVPLIERYTRPHYFGEVKQ
ncbi:MAG TPA: RnfABCDGE type electron transport complex subunit D [Defluviitaleaceae bacterium]|jgi:electron transport complex protein RnfD|nr:RnfABCDGE type electron transport complex subunit D [Candidatus Epulonipiscium sp.]HOQ16111.1 RnfABCDGE type electron transport complex subunit D [Defluviitaleaceae bacterium]HPT75437.1 RnfABCDGE type electron transport complex subunit D [Defluviitaleaceae bacterium]HQD49995.1 RnfABCDGE type electron transport complex subunit D [Defluviitaleaceae bacterium]